MGEKNQLIKDQTPLVGEEIDEFQSKLETITYFALTTRYDIVYPAARISQFIRNPLKIDLRNHPFHLRDGFGATRQI